MKRLFVHRNIVLLATISMVVLSLFMLNMARADSWSWTTGVPTTVYSDAVSPDDDWNNVCASKFQSIRDQRKIEGVEDQSRQFHTACVIGSGDNYQLFEGDDGKLAVSFAGESNAHVINSGATCFYGCVYMPSRDYLISIQSPGTFGDGKLVIFKDFVKRLRMQSIILPNLRIETYFTGEQSPDEILTDRFIAEDFSTTTKHLQRSQNDKWLVFELVGRGMYRMDMDTGNTTKFLYLTTKYWDPGTAPSMQIDVTNDGRHVAIFGRNTSNAIYELTPDCGFTVPSDPAQIKALERQGQLTTECPALYLAAPMNDPANNTYMPNLTTAYQPKFSEDGGEISFYATSSSSPVHHVSLRAANYTGPPPLDYLALGDSYSSGEGDIDKKQNGTSYYMPTTDYDGGCHISERSYPFILSSKFNISSSRVQSVACSSAETKDIDGSLTYFGQGNRLNSLTLADMESKQANAVKSFIPGYVRQIDFVYTYLPTSITITIGGNDLGFANKLKECAETRETCKYASDDQWRAIHGYEIQNMFSTLKKLYESIQNASPKSKIYTLGYPTFINPEGWRHCGWDDGYLNNDEKELLDESVKYMNSVIKAASEASGVKYIDIESSLNGGRICDFGGEYITGLQDVAFDAKSSGLFHPNAKGHEKIAQSIEHTLGTKNILTYSNNNPPVTTTAPPPASSYFLSSMSTYDESNIHHVSMTNDVVTKGTTVNVAIDRFSLLPDSEASTMILSKSYDVGSFKVSADGSLSANIQIPSDIKPGYHTLLVQGLSYTNEPIKIYQSILVQGSNQYDRDEDGISDLHDACMYIEPSGYDIDHDGIDDMCDPKIQINNNAINSNRSVEINTLEESIESGTSTLTPVQHRSSELSTVAQAAAHVVKELPLNDWWAIKIILITMFGFILLMLKLLLGILLLRKKS